MMKTALIVQRRLTHYRVPLFNALKSSLERRGVRLRVLAGEGTPTEKLNGDQGYLEWAESLPTNYWLSGKLCWQPIHRYVGNVDLVILTQENAQIANQLMVLRQLRPKVAFWGHGRDFQAGDRIRLRDRYKSWVSRKVEWWFAYTRLSAEAVERAGFDPARITVLNNSVEMCPQGSIGTMTCDPEVLSLLREGLVCGDGPIGVFVGSLYRDKRLDFLFAALDRIKQQVPAFSCILIGDGPDRNHVYEFCANRRWAVWVGPKFGPLKLSYLSKARILLNPGLVGLGILDSFAVGLPMITTDCGIHSPEIAYLRSDENGLMTENTLAGFVDGCVTLLRDDVEWSRLRQGALRSADEYNLENMTIRFTDGICKALAND